MILTGGCYCGDIRYELDLKSLEDARTSLCHCMSCKVRCLIFYIPLASTDRYQRFFGTAFGLTTKVPKETFRILRGNTKEHVSDNGSTTLHREFCDNCGTGILEYGVCVKFVHSPP